MNHHERPEHLADVAEARLAWEGARDREQLARSTMVAAIAEARGWGASLREIAAELGTTRQYVQKLLRESARVDAEDERTRRRYERGADQAIRDSRAGIGRVNCGVCGRFKPRPSSVCDYCGDEPGTYNGDPRDHDESVYGSRVA